MSKYRNWCFTINNPSNDEIETCDTIKCDYIIFGFEIGESKTPHLQGYIEFKDAKTLRTLKKIISNRGHFEQRRGSAKEASDYCKKDGLFIEHGNLSNQGKRNDLTDLANLVKEKGVKGVVDEKPEMFIKYGRNIERLAGLLMKRRTTKPYVVWLWGLTGTGKTYTATRSLPEGKDYYIWTGTKWWNNYSQQHRVIADDYAFDGTNHGFRYLLRLLDAYAIEVETKGGTVYFNSPEIYITCEYPPHHIFREGNELDQVLRRIDKIQEMGIKDVIYQETNDIVALTPQLEPVDNIDELPYI